MPELSKRWVWVLLLLLAAIALLARSLGYPGVFMDDGTVVLAFDDSSYHARLVHEAVANFPVVRSFDPLLNHPDGARVPWPPLYDWLLALVAWLFGGGPFLTDRVLAWASPVFGVLAVVPIYFGARSLVGRVWSLVAVALYALIPITVMYARLGNPDHHAWLAMLSASYLALSFAAIGPDKTTAGRAAAALIAVRLLVVLSWSGSLLYLALGEGALLLAALVGGRAEVLRRQGIGAVVACACVAAFVSLLERPLGGWLSASALSGMHVLFFAGLATVVGGVVYSDVRWPSDRWLVRLLRASGVAVSFVAVALLSASVREGLLPALQYVSVSEGFIGNPEQFPVYMWMRSGFERQIPGSFTYYGAFALVLPLCPLGAIAALRDRERAAQALILLVWSVPLCVLAVLQLRWGNDFAPAAVTGFALGCGLLWDRARRVGGGASKALRAVIVACVIALIASVGATHLPKLEYWVALKAGTAENRLAPPAVGMTRFAHRVKEALAERRGDSTEVVSVLASPRYGHLLHYVAGTATPADNFGPQFNPTRYDEVLRFLGVRREAKAVEIARRLASNYVMTDRPAGRAKDLIVVRLHRDDGSASGAGRGLGHFRLIAEGRADDALQGASGYDAPYKLFEVVEGAILDVGGEPESRATAEVLVRTKAGRGFTWRTTARVAGNGRALLHVPYASAYRVTANHSQRLVEVSEEAVLRGSTIRVD